MRRQQPKEKPPPPPWKQLQQPVTSWIAIVSVQAREMLLSSVRVVPAALQAEGYAFRHPDVGPALGHALGRLR